MITVFYNRHFADEILQSLKALCCDLISQFYGKFV